MLKHLFFVSAIAMGGCVNSNANYVPTQVQLSEPRVDAVNTVGVGETMLLQGRFNAEDSILVEREIPVGEF